MDFAAWLSAKNIKAETLDEATKLALQASWRLEQNPPTPPTPPPLPPRPAPVAGSGENSFDKARAEMRAETERQEEIRGLTETALKANVGNKSKCEKIETLYEAAIKEPKTTAKDFKHELFVIDHTRGPLVFSPSQPQMTDEVLECALAQSARLSSVDKDYGPQVREAAHKSFRGGLGLQQVLLIAAQSNGYRSSAPVKSNLREVLQYSFAPMQSGISTISIAGILSNIQNKFLTNAFMGVEQEWSKIAARRNFNDFKTVTTYSLSGDATFEEIPPGGMIPHGTMNETTYTNQAKSYGKMYGIDRRDIINDDLSVFSRIGQRLGRGGAIRFNKVFWGIFLNNSSFFTAGNSNVTTGAGSLLSGATGITALDAALAVFKLQKDPDGDLMAAMPKILLAPPALFVSARDLMDSAKKVATTTANSGMPDGNPFAGMFEVVSSAYMQDTTLTGNSATASYLLADPNDIPVIEAGFLNGQETPIVETAEADFNQLGAQYRGYFDFGVALQEFRGGVRLAGA